MKASPFCAEQIQDQAIVCRFCSRSLTTKPVAYKTISQQEVDAMAPAAFEAAWMAPMTEAQRQVFLAQMHVSRRSSTTGVLLALFLGGLGAHRFYLGDMWGIAYLLFCWTFIPSIVALIEALVMSSRVDAHNKAEAHRIASQILATSAHA